MQGERQRSPTLPTKSSYLLHLGTDRTENTYPNCLSIVRCVTVAAITLQWTIFTEPLFRYR
jgi:hypothetical protein